MLYRRSTILATIGLVALVAWTFAWTATSALAVDYNPNDQYISELFETGASTRPHMTVFIALHGLGVLALAASLLGRVARLVGSRVVPLLIAAAGVGTLGAASFPCDPGCTIPPDASWHGSLHWLFSFVFFSALAIAALITAYSLRDEPVTSGFRLLSAIVGLTSIPLGVVLLALNGDPGTGVVQRLNLAVLTVWLIVLASRVIALRPVGEAP